MTALQKYDAIVIGASTAAVSRLCPTLAQAGWKTARIEREHEGRHHPLRVSRQQSNL